MKYLLGVVSFWWFSAFQIQALSLSDAFLEAEKENPYLQKVKAERKAAAWGQLDALSRNLPRGYFSLGHSFSEKYQILDVNLGGSSASIAQVYPETTYSLGLQWTVFDGLQTPLAFRASQLSATAADLELERSRSRLRSEIRVKFFQALAAQELAEVARQNVRTLEDHLNKAVSRRKAGEITRFDSLRVQVQLEEARPELKSAEDNVVLSRQALAESLGRSSDERALEGKLPPPEHLQLVNSLSLDIQKRADLLAAEKRVEAAENLYSASLGTWAPRVSVAADKTFYNNRDHGLFDSDQFRNSYSVGLVLTWNILDAGNLAKNEIAAAEMEHVRSQARSVTLHAPYEFDYWKRRYAYATELYAARKRAVEASEESVRLAHAGWSAGSRTSTDILDAELDLFRARAGIIRSELDAIEAISNLELALGRTLL